MTKNDIRRIYTEKVAELLAKGYILHPETMSGSQGEIAHIDLTNGSEILRVLIENCGWENESYGDVLSIRIGRCTESLRGSHPIIWNNRLETLFEIKLAKISETFYTTPDESQRMAEVRLNRYGWRSRRHDRRIELGDAYKSIALRWLRRQPRMKSCKMEDITRMVRLIRHGGKVCYEITAKGRNFRIHA